MPRTRQPGKDLTIAFALMPGSITVILPRHKYHCVAIPQTCQEALIRRGQGMADAGQTLTAAHIHLQATGSSQGGLAERQPGIHAHYKGKAS